MRNTIVWLLLAASCALAGAQAALPLAGHNLRLPVQSIKQVREAGTVLQQYDFSCGSAALATLLTHHYGHPVTENDVLQQMYASGDQQKIRSEGFSLLDMKRYLADAGYTADGFEQPLDKLADARIPAIVLINEAGYHHFVVVKGLVADRILVGDPARGTRAIPRSNFESAWIGRLLFVIHNHVDKARFNLASDWRAAPRAPLGIGLPQEGLAGTGLAKHSAGDF